MSFGNLNGQTAIVTGGGRGIGRAICIKLASLGANVVINYTHSEHSAKETLELCGGSARAVTVQADVSAAEDCERIYAAAERFGTLDILINNAGITRDGLLAVMNTDDFDRVLEVNLKGAFLMTKLAFRPMSRKRYGRIVNISSVTGIGGNAGQANYAASKAGLIGFTKSAAKEYGKRGITVNAIAPGFIESDMTAPLTETQRSDMLKLIPAGRFGDASEVASCAAFLCSGEAAYINGQVIRVDGGMAF